MPDDRGIGQVDWSYSNARRYEACQRAFYYQQRYFNGTDPISIEGDFESPITVQASPGALVGIAVHRSIGQQVDRWRRGDQMNLTEAQETAADLVREYSEHHEISGQASGRTPDEIRAILISTVESHLKTFSQVIWPRFSSHRYITHETLESFPVGGHRVWVRPDLCTRDQSGRLVITDWKTGSLDPFAEPTLQMLVYALWAHKQFEPDLTRIRVQQAFTSEGQIQSETVSDGDLQSLQQRVVTDCEEWMEKSTIYEFSTSPAIECCQNCPFLSECDDGNNIL